MPCGWQRRNDSLDSPQHGSPRAVPRSSQAGPGPRLSAAACWPPAAPHGSAAPPRQRSRAGERRKPQKQITPAIKRRQRLLEGTRVNEHSLSTGSLMCLETHGAKTTGTQKRFQNNQAFLLPLVISERYLPVSERCESETQCSKYTVIGTPVKIQ